MSPPPDSGPGEERVAPTVELRGLRRLPGLCAAPGQVEAEPAKVNGECPGIRRGGGPGGTVASASENFLGTASLGRSSNKFYLDKRTCAQQSKSMITDCGPPRGHGVYSM